MTVNLCIVRPAPQAAEKGIVLSVDRSPDEVLEEAARRFAPRIALALGFGREGCVLLDMIARASLPIRVFTLDTGLLFPETYALWRRLEERTGIRIEAVRPGRTVEEQAEAEGEALWARQPDRCCELRKVGPLGRALAGLDAWVTAIRREQTTARASAVQVEHDHRHGLVKINPLAAWSGADVASYVTRHGVPTNPLHDNGYESIGCFPCTTRVLPGEDPRAGRWRGAPKTECGLHLPTRIANQRETERNAP